MGLAHYISQAKSWALRGFIPRKRKGSQGRSSPDEANVFDRRNFLFRRLHFAPLSLKTGFIRTNRLKDQSAKQYRAFPRPQGNARLWCQRRKSLQQNAANLLNGMPQIDKTERRIFSA